MEVPPGEIEEVAATSRADWITDALRDAILAREFQPGQKLRVVQVAARFSVSATPVREALARLTGEGIVTYSPQRGARVAELSGREMVDVYELRALLEPLALRRSLRGTTPELCAEVSAAHAAMSAALTKPFVEMTAEEYSAYEQRHLAFHKALLSNCGSRWLAQFTSILADQSSRFRRLSLEGRGGHLAVAAEHEEILVAFCAGEVAPATAAIAAHMTRTQQAIAGLLAE